MTVYYYILYIYVTWWFDSIVIIYYIFNLIKCIVVLIHYILVNIYIGAIAWIYNGRVGFIYVRLIKCRILWCCSFHHSTSRLNDQYLVLLNDVVCFRQFPRISVDNVLASFSYWNLKQTDISNVIS